MINYPIVMVYFVFNLITDSVICVDAPTINEVNNFNNKLAVGFNKTF